MTVQIRPQPKQVRQSVLLPRKIGELELDFENPTWKSNLEIQVGFEEFAAKSVVNSIVRFTINFNVYNVAHPNLS